MPVVTTNDPPPVGKGCLFSVSVQQGSAIRTVHPRGVRGTAAAPHGVSRQHEVGPSDDHVGLGEVCFELEAKMGVEEPVGRAQEAAALRDQVPDRQGDIGLHVNPPHAPRHSRLPELLRSPMRHVAHYSLSRDRECAWDAFCSFLLAHFRRTRPPGFEGTRFGPPI